MLAVWVTRGRTNPVTSLKGNYSFAQLLDHVDAPPFDAHHCVREE